MEDDPAPQLISEERLEEGEDHIEDIRLVHYVDVFNAQGYAILKTFMSNGSLIVCVILPGASRRFVWRMAE